MARLFLLMGTLSAWLNAVRDGRHLDPTQWLANEIMQLIGRPQVWRLDLFTA